MFCVDSFYDFQDDGTGKPVPYNALRQFAKRVTCHLLTCHLTRAVICYLLSVIFFLFPLTYPLSHILFISSPAVSESTINRKSKPA